MKMENLDLFKDLMEQAKVKAQCDAEDRGKTDSLADSILQKSKGLPGEIKATKTGDGLSVEIACCAVDAVAIAESIVESVFKSLNDLPDAMARIVMKTMLVERIRKTLKDCLANDMKGVGADE